MSNKTLMLGNYAVARGLYEAGATVVSSYPGTPSTEITQAASKFREAIWCEWAPNEKVAMEVALGASIAGARAFTGMKHVGLNVAADPLFTASYTGVNGGLVVAVADDPGMHSSQNEQDSRNYARSAKVPMLEPASSAECLEFTKAAFNISEDFDAPVLIRLSTRISHSQGLVEEGERVKRELPDYKKDASKYVMTPAFARQRRVKLEEREKKLLEFSESNFYKQEFNNSEIGVIASGICYQYAKEALGENANYLKLGIINPLPIKLIKDFALKCKKVYVIEELDGIIEAHCRGLGLSVIGKELFGSIGEYSSALIKEKILGEKPEYVSFPEEIPSRPPVLCAGCPHRPVFYVLGKLGVMVNGDIGCYTLGAAPPLSAMDTTICMGFSVSGLHGFNKGRSGDYEAQSVAVIGDSTFIHSGITGLINVAYNKSNSTIIILDNSTTGMTGHQNNPANGYDIYGDVAAAVNLEALCKSVGINRVSVIGAGDLSEIERAVKQELAAKEPSVIIVRTPCALLKSVKPKPSLSVNADKCSGCKMCMKIGCPAVTVIEKKAAIDKTLCVGCGLCAQMCKLEAIK